MDNKNTQKTEKDIKIEKLAAKVMDIARDRIAVSLRFLDIALAEIKLIAKKDIKDKNETSGGGMATDGQYVYYDPEWVLRTYKEEPSRVTRTYLHLLLHLIFFHPFSYDKLDKVLWDLASDVAVESAMRRYTNTSEHMTYPRPARSGGSFSSTRMSIFTGGRRRRSAFSSRDGRRSVRE